MPKYLVVMKGEGEGCDYTIGCNMLYKIVESERCLSDFVEHFANKVTDPSEFSDPGVVRLIIAPFEHCQDVDLRPYKQVHRDRRDAEKKAEQEARDRAELERLKKKLGE